MQTIYMINCRKNNSNCFFSKGIHIFNIPFNNYDNIYLQKITFYNNKQFIYNLFPAFYNFLKAIKIYFKICRNINLLLNRELNGNTTLPQFRKILLGISANRQ